MKKIGNLIHTVDVLIKRRIDRLAIEYDLTSVQFIAMDWIYHASKDRDVYQRDLETALNVRRSTVSNVLGLLEKKNYVVRESVTADARLKKLLLTPAGIKVFKEFGDRLDIAEAEDFRIFSQEEKETLINLLERLSDSIR